MLPWIPLDTATLPGANRELRLKRRGAEFSIMLGTIELMNSRLSGSEEALATLVATRLAACRMGYALRGHGVYAWGTHMDDALAKLEATEFLLACELAARSMAR